MVPRADGVRLATRGRPGKGPTVVFLPGFMSDMRGTKASYLDEWAERTGRAYLRFDYSGCGESEGDFADGTISRWAADASRVMGHLVPGQIILVGSSMGGWIALRLACDWKRVAGVLLLAPAPDFTRWGISDAERAEAAMTGGFTRPSKYGGDHRYTHALLVDGETCALLDGPIACPRPVTIIQGQADPDVPWALSLSIAERLTSTQVRTVLVKDGDHRLSRPQDLDLMTRELELLKVDGVGEYGSWIKA